MAHISSFLLMLFQNIWHKRKCTPNRDHGLDRRLDGPEPLGGPRECQLEAALSQDSSNQLKALQSEHAACADIISPLYGEHPEARDSEPDSLLNGKFNIFCCLIAISLGKNPYLWELA